jgi:hypothetical protein
MLGGFCEFHGLEYPHYPHNPDTQTEKTSYWLSKVYGRPRSELWGPLGYEFWANLKPYPWAHELIGLLAEKVGMERICILTSPITTDGCLDGKIHYIRKNFPEFSRRFLIGPAKEFCAGPGHALIDDHEGNTEPFVEAGGQAFLFPAPYNANFKEHPIPALKRWLETINVAD